MYLDESRFPYGGGPDGPSCRACKQPILESERSLRVTFADDPNGLTGEYHAVCGRPFKSLADALDLMSRFGR